MCKVGNEIINTVSKQVINQLDDDTMYFIYVKMWNQLKDQIILQVKNSLNNIGTS